MNPRPATLLALAVAAAACGPKVAKEQPTAQDPAFTFPHSIHVDADVACKSCHPMETVTRLQQGVRDVKIPANASKQKPCSDCHDADPKPALPKRMRPFRQSFSHADHLPRVNGDCRRCHETPPEQGDTVVKGPSMDVCTSCHNHQQDFVEARCKPCHVDLKGYEAAYAFKHEGDWLPRHGSVARPSAESCAACHDQTYCSQCHSPQTAAGRPSILFPERVERSYIHRGDYVPRHAVDAGANPASCRRCHGSAFCEACHTQQNLTKSGSDDPFRPDTHKQLNWASPPSVGALPLHAHAARRDIASCAGCHDQGVSSTCVLCHQVGGFASQNNPSNHNGPHPSSFISKHRGEDKTKNGMCAACHPAP